MQHATTFLERETVLDLARPILARRMAEFGFRDVDLREDTDFDGEPILRMGVRTDREFTARAMTDATDAIRVELLGRDDPRYVFISPVPNGVALGGGED